VREIGHEDCKTILVAAFDAKADIDRVRLFAPRGVEIIGFDSLRIPDEMLSNKKRYLSNLNFATNFAFFRDGDGHHTRLVTANYWANYGAKGGQIWFVLFGGDGRELAVWHEPLPGANAAIVIDSKHVRERFSLGPFTGQLFMHVIGAAGHDIVKYALDTYGDGDEILSCTHDANSWPANRYAGLPAPAEGEEVVLWVQNAHPFAIEAGEIGLNLMGEEHVALLNVPLAPFATYRLSVAELLPDARWPQQVEIRAGKHMVRPRYEVIRSDGRRNIAHPNVEREDLETDEKLAGLGDVLGKGFILPAPILPPERYKSFVLPTPMSTAQNHLPIKLLLFDASGASVAQYRFGNLRRSDSVVLDVDEVLENCTLESGYGHMELVYDFDAGSEADGWLHALFRYVDRKSTHQADTSFGAHIFNTLMTYKNEPQSYKGPPPGLSTRLFLRLGPAPCETMCHLIYPASLPWHEKSCTALILMSEGGEEVARCEVGIPCGGSLRWRVSDMFDAEKRKKAGAHGHVIVRDTTCRLFGYHGLINGDSAFSLDHMFGF
ncbi:MAG: hypothetical protein IID54_00855, partial [Proteobacteria bacterium]|nr:hypothetical protein [Pseudomonadota bacterium]